MPDPREIDDLLPGPEEFDAAQFALHGLLSRYLGTDPADVRRRADDIIANWRTLRGDEAGDKHSLSLRSLWSTRARRWAAGGAGLAAAACLLLWAMLFREPDLKHAVTANPINAVGFDPRLTIFQMPLAEADAKQMRTQIGDQMQAVEKMRAALLPSHFDDPQHTQIITLMNLWVNPIRAQRDLGQFDAALANAQAALAFVSGDNAAHAPIRDWMHILWNDIGSIQTAAGNYPAASNAFARSIELRKQNILDNTLPSDQPDNERVRVTMTAGDLTPLYWQLSYLALLQNNLSDARRWQHEAEAALRAFFLAVCKAAGTTPPPGASLLDCYRAMPLQFQAPQSAYSLPEVRAFERQYAGFTPDLGKVVKLKSQLVREARLLRLEGRFDEALRTLAIAMTIPGSDCHDEDHLGFFLPIEVVRAALMAGRTELALQYVEQAQKNTAPTTCPTNPDLNKPAVTGLPLLELDLLQAAALLAYAGQNEPRATTSGPSTAPPEVDQKRESSPMLRPQARERAIEILARTLAQIDKITSTLPADQQHMILTQFSEWRALATPPDISQKHDQ